MVGAFFDVTEIDPTFTIGGSKKSFLFIAVQDSLKSDLVTHSITDLMSSESSVHCRVVYETYV